MVYKVCTNQVASLFLTLDEDFCFGLFKENIYVASFGLFSHTMSGNTVLE